MSTLLQRLRAALAPEYEVIREISSGGMGLVFVARDVGLDRRVAIKVLRPELATAQAAERFLREARLLARLSHPNIVPVHDAGEADGFFFYVMDYVESETLAERLKRGPLEPDAALRLGRDLLDALEAAHAVEIVHRDLKPGNIFLVGSRALLADFGIAKPGTKDGAAATTPGATVGTPGYMPPEQAAGEGVTPRTDLYAAGMVLYEAFTGRRWSILSDPQRADWTGVPRATARLLRRALAWSPDERWPDAASFRRALWRTRTSSYRWRAAALAAGGVTVGALLVIAIFGDGGAPSEEPSPADLVILPFEVVGAEDAIGEDLARLAALGLEGMPQLRLVPARRAFRWWDAVEATPRATPEEAARALRARHVAQGDVVQVGDSLEARLRVVDAAGTILPGSGVVSGHAADLLAFSEAVAFQILSVAAPRLAPVYSRAGGLPETSGPAIREFLLGEAAFERNAWPRALRHYAAAAKIDPEFAPALWHAVLAWEWMGRGIPYPDVDLEHLYAEHGHQLSPADRGLLEADLIPPGPQRFTKLEALRARYPEHIYAAAQYGDELLTRGPLFGIPTARAAQVLAEAAAHDSFFSPTYADLAMALTALGRRAEARAAVIRLQRISAPPEELEPEARYLPPFLWQAFYERFHPDSAALRRAAFLGAESAEARSALRFAARWGLWFDLPETQLALGAQLVAAAGSARSRAEGHQAQALALIDLGRVTEAIAHLDSAAALFETPEAHLQAAEWRVVPAALGLPGWPESEVARGRAALRSLVASPVHGPRAAFALALHALAAGDTVEAARLRALVSRERGPAATRLDALLGALGEASRGRVRRALERSAPLRSHYVLTREAPFARAVLYVQRGRWWAELENEDAADAEWLWVSNQDLLGYLGDEAQPAEIDWAFAAYARWLRGRLTPRPDRAAACEHWGRLADLWAQADPPLRDRARDAGERAREGCAP